MSKVNSDTPVVILAGGLGTRLREETEYRPKPMVDIGGRPILLHIMQHYSSFGFRRFFICVGYKGDMIRDYFLNYRGSDYAIKVELSSGKVTPLSVSAGPEDWEISIVDTGRDTLTGGRLLQIEKFINQPVFMATYGDGLSDIDLKKVADFHIKHKGVATVSVVRPMSRFGSIDFSDDGKVTRFREKELSREWINGGYFFFNKDIFRYLDNDSLETGTMNRLIANGQLNAYQHDGFWQCMDTPRELQELNRLWSSGSAPWIRRNS